MQERVSLIAELEKAGASELKIEDERKKLQELETVAYKVNDICICILDYIPSIKSNIYT
jgi:hypothetical protein